MLGPKTSYPGWSCHSLRYRTDSILIISNVKAVFCMSTTSVLIWTDKVNLLGFWLCPLRFWLLFVLFRVVVVVVVWKKMDNVKSKEIISYKYPMSCALSCVCYQTDMPCHALVSSHWLSREIERMLSSLYLRYMNKLMEAGIFFYLPEILYPCSCLFQVQEKLHIPISVCKYCLFQISASGRKW